MATRSIVTSHPDVECDVCGRRLLRGEQPDVFVSGGQRRTVCELCAPRATHEGWLRESDGHTLNLRTSRPQRARSILDRLRQMREPESRSERRYPTTRATEDADRQSRRAARDDRNLYDFLDSSSPAGADPLDSLAPVRVEGGSHHEAPYLEAEGEPGGHDDWIPSSSDLAAASGTEAAQESPLATQDAPTAGEARTTRALAVFNRGEHPRRVAGVARSLGAPSVRAAPVADSGSVVAILVAWELCWYRYEVDLGDEAAGARLVSQGLELDELADEERIANATADDRGELSVLLG